MMNRIPAAVLLMLSLPVMAQTGPGGVGSNDGTSTLHGWWKADAGVTSSGGSVSAWDDQSGYGNDLSQLSAGNQPTITTSVSLNSQAVINYAGSSSQFFNSSLTGPNTNNITMFLVANGSSYQSLFRFQNTPPAYVVFPWEGGGGEVFITSSDGGTGGGIATGLVTGANNVSAVRYRRNTTNGMQAYLNGAINAQRNSVNSALPNQPFFSGIYNPGSSEYPTADVGELIYYAGALNDAQMIIVQNYLAAKFNVALSSNDVYTMDNSGNGNYDYDVAGIGRVDASNIQSDSRGTGIVRIRNAGDLEDGEFFMWGDDGGSLVADNTTDIPSGVTARFDRIWRVSETGGDGDVGNIDIEFDVTGLSDFASLSTCDAALSIRLLVDTNNDGFFADQTPISGATNIGGNVYRFANMNLANGNRFTLALSDVAVDGPGGVGGTNGNTSLALWMDGNKGVSTSGGNVTLWSDQSGHGITASAPASGNRPAYNSTGLNGQGLLTFDGSDDYLDLSSNITTTTPTFFIVANKPATGSGFEVMMVLDDNAWFSRAVGSNQWGMYNNTNVTSGSTLSSTYSVLSAVEHNYDNVDFYTNGSNQNKTNGTAYFGRSTGTIGADNGGTPGSGNRFFAGSLSEVILYNTNLNNTSRIIIENALAAKYGLTLSANDIYTQDDAPGNFDFDVAGIGRINSSDLHSSAKGQDIITVSNPTDLGNGEYFFWGHDSNPEVASTNDCPAGIQARFKRTWAVTEVGEVGSIDVQFDLNGQTPVTASDLRLLIDHDGDGIFNEGGTITVSGATALSCNNYVFSGISQINDGMRFTLATVNDTQTPLPVELASFVAACDNGKTALTWTTISERNTDHFIVERSVDGEIFSPVGKVSGHGTSSVVHSYFLGDNPPVGRLYYRLSSVDFDGKSSYLKTTTTENSALAMTIRVFPNPIRRGDVIHVVMDNQQLHAQGAVLTLTDLYGRKIAITPAWHDGEISIPTGPDLPAGVYLVGLTWGQRSVFQKVYLN